MVNWEFKILEEAKVEFIDGDRGANYPKKSELLLVGDCLFLNTGNVKESGFDFSSVEFITSEKDSLLRKGKLQRNDIVLTTRGTVGNVALFSDDVLYKNIRINSGMVIVRVNEQYWNPYFLYLFFQSESFKKQAQIVTSGSAQPQLPISVLKTLSIPEISLQEQNMIVDKIKSIDDTVTLNNQINQELEAMAKTLYDYWFVQFDFPDENGKPYKTSGGKMVYNDQLKREIPEGWGVPLLSDVSKYVTDKISVANLDSENYIGTDNMIAGMKGIRLAQFLPIDTMATKYTVGDVLISNIRPYFKKIWQAERNGGCSSDVLCIRSNVEALSEFIYASLARDDFFSYNVAGSKGSKMPRGDKKHIMNYKLVYDDLLARFFSSTVRPFYEKIAENNKQNQELSRLRDWLLPMLMNGQVRVE